MESFDLNAALFAPSSGFNSETWEVSVHFGNEDNFLDKAEEWLSIDDDECKEIYQ